LIRRAAAAVFVAGIAGMIVGSLADNNNGAVVTAGLCTAVAALVLLAVNAVDGPGSRVAGPDEAQAELVERQVAALVEHGADESALRDLVRAAVKLGRSVS
jgi:hypothetical protein